MSISLRIKELINTRKLSQKDVAASLLIDSSQFSKIVNGKLQPTIVQLMEISSFFKISIDWLCFGTGEVNSVKSESASSVNEPAGAYSSDPANTELLLDKIKYLQEQNLWFKNHIEFLTEQLSIKNQLDKQRIQEVFEKMNEIEKAAQKESEKKLIG